MIYNVLTTDLFNKEFKALCKKHQSAKDDVISFIQKLKENPLQGVSLGNDCYKIRIAIKSKKRGKSAGARLITRVRITQTTIYLLSIYDKAEKDTISNKELQAILNSL